MAKNNKSVWNEVDKDQEPDVYKIIKNKNLDNLINGELDLDEDDFDYELDYDDVY
jgi:hypothetical protein